MANSIQRRKDPGSMVQRDRGWDPFEQLQELMRFDPYREFSFPLLNRSEAFVPAFEVKETNQGYVFQADLPGVKEKDLDISLKGNRLTISGTRDEEKKEDTDRYFTYERSYGAFSRTFTLPGDVDEEHVEANLKDGVLAVTIPKSPQQQPKKIEVKAKSSVRSDKDKAEA
jgi:HSP20 family protein